MDRLRFDDVELTYERRGRGDRIVLVHASPFVSWYGPLIEQLTDFSTLRYRRRLVPPAAVLAGGLRDFFAGRRRPPASPGTRAAGTVSAAGERSGTR
jgi:hypothetical protein